MSAQPNLTADQIEMLGLVLRLSNLMSAHGDRMPPAVTLADMGRQMAFAVAIQRLLDVGDVIRATA